MTRYPAVTVFPGRAVSLGCARHDDLVVIGNVTLIDGTLPPLFVSQVATMSDTGAGLDDTPIANGPVSDREKVERDSTEIVSSIDIGRSR